MLTDLGVDAHEAVTLTYTDSRAVAVCGANMWARSATTAAVVGTDARVDVAGEFYRPTSFTVTPLRGEPWLWEGDGLVGGGFEFEAAEVARCIGEGRRESATLPWQATLEVMEIMDEVRRQLGVVYPGE